MQYAQQDPYAPPAGGIYSQGGTYVPQPAVTPYADPAYATSQPSQPQPAAFGTPPQPASYGTPQQPASYGTPQQPASYGTPQQPASYGTLQHPASYGTPQQLAPYGPQQPASYGTPQQPAPYGTPAYTADPYGQQALLPPPAPSIPSAPTYDPGYANYLYSLVWPR
ncbi:hypothetical protein MRX96_043878, partial [Rhipicephalus microplus]